MGNCFSSASQIVDPVQTPIKQVPAEVPDRFQIATIGTGKKGRAPGELCDPRGVAIDEATHQIFVANSHNNRVEIFSETGEYICQLGVGELNRPQCIAIHGDNVYVSCWDYSVSRFSRTDMRLVRRIEGVGFNLGQFYYPCQLTTDPIGRVFITDTEYHRICIHNPDLNYLYNITHQSMTHPCDVKVSRDRVYVLCPFNNPCMLVLTLEGDKLHSLITRGMEMDMEHPLFFCFDPLNNFQICGHGSHSIRVFSPEGNLLYKIGREAQQGTFYQVKGIAITPNGRSVCVSENRNYRLQISC